MSPRYDAIVVGARCAGAPTAMLLARKGHRVLLVDRATFPSDTISTHLLHPPAVSALQRWGLLDRLIATGCPAITSYNFDFGPFVITGRPGTAESPVAYGPRRTVLDKLLVDAAAEAGVEVREAFTVEHVLTDGSRVTGIRGHSRGDSSITEQAAVVIGADGYHSHVARAVGAEQYHERPPLEVSYYTYWSGLPMDGRFEAYDRGNRGFAAWPTHDDRTLVICGLPYAEFAENKKDIEGNYMKTIALAPAFAERVSRATREEPFAGMALAGFFRKPFGPGWALVGDAGYTKDFITAYGILDAFAGAEACAAALDRVFSGQQEFDAAMGAFQAARDAKAIPMYEFTCDFAAMQPAPPERKELMGAIYGNQEAMDAFAATFAGVISPADFFSEENVGRIFAARAKG